MEKRGVDNVPGKPLAALLTAMASDCIQCGLCLKECAFLRRYGSPGDIAEGSLEHGLAISLECSLCGLCRAVCPRDLDCGALMLALREEAVARNQGHLSEHDPIRFYEGKGVSPLFTWYSLPQGCDTVFFPGCTLPGTRPQATRELFSLLQERIEHLGIVLDCCTKPSHDLGDRQRFDRYFQEAHAYLTGAGIHTVVVACPNCFKVFAAYGAPLRAAMIWEYLDSPVSLPDFSGVEVTVHDPCVLRHQDRIQDLVRGIVQAGGLTIREMAHARDRTVCCGEGGSAGFVDPHLAAHWSDMRKTEAGTTRVVTYCAGCAHLLRDKGLDVVHLLDLYLHPSAALAGRAQVSRAPLTYWNRLRLKRYFQKKLPGALQRQRPVLQQEKPGTLVGKLLVLLFLAAGVAAFRMGGLARLLDPEVLHPFLQRFPLSAPLIYIALYGLAPSLFLPGLPLTLAGGVLFGPFWGVVYAISGATLGATLAFLISRYMGRDIVARRLRGPRWKRLDGMVAEQGWKVVALTRLIPLFPFNLLNYAFGLTSIRLVPYVIASFLFMLPGCIAYVVFSSSIFDLFRGRVTPGFVAGLAGILVLSLIPLLYKRFKKQ